MASLPNVYSELPQGTFDGATLIIKNTFIDVSPSSAEFASRFSKCRSKSVPCLLAELSMDSPTASPTFLDFRRRMLTFDCGDAAADDCQKSPRSCTASTCTPASSAPPSPTTVLLKNIPEEYTRDMLVETLNAQGFAGLVDFVYSPMDFGTRKSFGYAYINLLTPEDADQFFTAFEDFSDWSVQCSRVADVDWSDRQGLEGLIERYRNSPLMHSKVPDEAKPIMLLNGIRAGFPAPTQTLKPLRIRQSKARRARNLGHHEIQD